MAELRVSHLIDTTDDMLNHAFSMGSYGFFVNIDEIQDNLSKIKAILPEEIKTAEMILKRRDDIYTEAQSRADRIISEAQNTAANILSESELIRAVREKAAKIQEQVKENCDEMRNKAIEETSVLRKNAFQDAVKTKESAQAYAEEILSKLERDIDQIHTIIRNNQEILSSQKEKISQLAMQEEYVNN